MTTPPKSSDAKGLIALAERMGIPVDEAVRQVGQLIDLGPSVENANVLRTLCAADARPATSP
jgi:hypothetical protein